MHLKWDEIVPKLKSAVLAAGIVLAAVDIAEAGCAQIAGTNAMGTTQRNGCSYDLVIRWIDQGYCRGGCVATVSGGGSALTLAVQGGARVWECERRAYNSGRCRLP